MAVKTDLAAMSIQFSKDQRDQIKQKQPIDKDQEKDNYDTCNISIRVFVFYDTVYYNVNNWYVNL